MFTTEEVHEYAELLNNLNQEKEPTKLPLPDGYERIFKGGGRDGIPRFVFLRNKSKGIHYIWVRGTRFTCYNDLLINMRTKSTNFYEGHVHLGYYVGACGIINGIRSYLDNDECKKIICLGHSLGGAVSSVVTAILNKGNFGPLKDIGNLQNKFKNGNAAALVFATPPCFSQDISESTKAYITNLVGKKDIVPRLGKFFDSLKIFQKKQSAIWMYEANCLNKKSKKLNVKKLYTFDCSKDVPIDKLPGNAMIMNPSEKTMKPGKCSLKYKIQYLSGLIHHSFYTNYLKPIKALIPCDKSVFCQESIVKDSNLKPSDDIEKTPEQIMIQSNLLMSIDERYSYSWKHDKPNHYLIRGEKRYYFPVGFKGTGLKVDKFDEDTCVAYIGMKSDDLLKTIHDKFNIKIESLRKKQGKAKMFGVDDFFNAIFLSPSPRFASLQTYERADDDFINITLLQCRVNPKSFQTFPNTSIYKNCDPYYSDDEIEWRVTDPKAIQPYRILTRTMKFNDYKDWIAPHE